ncbi:MAG: hypothetical protein K9L61_02840 [Candidatus Omnitrophica bacterium]|nr:hypothetical protein [Candidatus Omnitrophota bacterium]
MKNVVCLFLVGMFVSGVIAFGQDNGQVAIQGVIEEISFEGSYLVVDGNKIIAAADFLDDFYLEEGDLVNIIAKNTPDGFEILEYEYVNLGDSDQLNDSEESEMPLEGEESHPQY